MVPQGLSRGAQRLVSLCDFAAHSLATNRRRSNAGADVGYNPRMSDQEIILHTLARVRRRLQIGHVVHDATVLLWLIAVAVALWRVLRMAGGHAPALSAVAILVALLLWVGGLLVLSRRLLARRTSLARAAAEVDSRAALHDELKTAYWFIAHPIASPWNAAQLEHAACSARTLDVSRLLPMRVERGALAASALISVLLVALWLAPPLTPSSQALSEGGNALSAAEAKQVQLLRELSAQLPGDSAAAAKLEQALTTLQRKEASAEEKQRALAAARAALEQRNLDAASTREGLYQLAQQLRGNEALKDIAAALEEGDAHKAAQALQQMPDAHGGKLTATSPAAERGNEKDLARLIDQASGRSDAEPGESASVAAREAIDRLNQIAAQLDSQQQLNQASQALQQLQLAVAQRSTMSAGRFSQQAAQNSTPSPNSGQTSMPGGIMFRSAAVAQEKRASAQQEGSKTGSAMGDSQAEAPLGNRVTPLGVQLKKEAVPNPEPEDQQDAAKNWFYTESKEQKSVVELREVQARESFAQAQSGAAEGVSVRHRQIVKDYFMQLREGKP